ncbi:MAG: tyrosine-type recombinase/integrase [Acidimicrobiaceae bacterium]|nr:tyrosine-type recombinase/integrase [Acidimicrobiaceae bacterium]
MLLLATTGVRAGEIMGLTLDDVDIASETIVVRGKGNKLRIVVLVPQVVEALDPGTCGPAPAHVRVLPDLWLGSGPTPLTRSASGPRTPAWLRGRRD